MSEQSDALSRFWELHHRVGDLVRKGMRSPEEITKILDEHVLRLQEVADTFSFSFNGSPGVTEVTKYDGYLGAARDVSVAPGFFRIECVRFIDANEDPITGNEMDERTFVPDYVLGLGHLTEMCDRQEGIPERLRQLTLLFSGTFLLGSDDNKFIPYAVYSEKEKKWRPGFRNIKERFFSSYRVLRLGVR